MKLISLHCQSSEDRPKGLNQESLCIPFNLIHKIMLHWRACWTSNCNVVITAYLLGYDQNVLFLLSGSNCDVSKQHATCCVLDLLFGLKDGGSSCFRNGCNIPLDQLGAYSRPWEAIQYVNCRDHMIGYKILTKIYYIVPWGICCVRRD